MHLVISICLFWVYADLAFPSKGSHLSHWTNPAKICFVLNTSKIACVDMLSILCCNAHEVILKEVAKELVYKNVLYSY